MKVHYTQHCVADIDDDEATRIMKQQLRNLGCWGDRFFIVDLDGRPALMKMETYATSHSWDERVFVREATPLDLAINTILNNSK